MDEERTRLDRRLADRIAAGDPAALEAVYDAYSGAIYRQALSILECRADAEDVVQDVFLKLVRRRGGPILDLKAYLLTAARHQACSSLRRSAPIDLMADPELLSRPVERGAEPRLDRQEIQDALEALPDDQREVVVLKVYEQMTFEEISRRVRASANTVASRYRYALKKLRRTLGDSADVS
jgi:RNA polymerase sigma-70 factor (ECF subfamily)